MSLTLTLFQVLPNEGSAVFAGGELKFLLFSFAARLRHPDTLLCVLHNTLDSALEGGNGAGCEVAVMRKVDIGAYVVSVNDNDVYRARGSRVMSLWSNPQKGYQLTVPLDDGHPLVLSGECVRARGRGWVGAAARRVLCATRTTSVGALPRAVVGGGAGAAVDGLGQLLEGLRHGVVC